MYDAREHLHAPLVRSALIPAIVITLSELAQGCGPTTTGDGPDRGPGGEDGGATTTNVETLHPDADPLPGETTCTVIKTTGIAVGPAVHVPICTSVKYATNPPSGGDHWGIWADFKEYSAPIPREVYVHDMEHGAVVLAYRCETSCPEVVKMLRNVLAEATPDTMCVSSNARILLTPDPKLDTPIAAAAWRATYTATCIDTESLAAFVAEVYGKGTEATCAPGIDFADPDAPVPMCSAPTGN